MQTCQKMAGQTPIGLYIYSSFHSYLAGKKTLKKKQYNNICLFGRLHTRFLVFYRYFALRMWVPGSPPMSQAHKKVPGGSFPQISIANPAAVIYFLSPTSLAMSGGETNIRSRQKIDHRFIVHRFNTDIYLKVDMACSILSVGIFARRALQNFLCFF